MSRHIQFVGAILFGAVLSYNLTVAEATPTKPAHLNRVWSGGHQFENDLAVNGNLTVDGDLIASGALLVNHAIVIGRSGSKFTSMAAATDGQLPFGQSG